MLAMDVNDDACCLGKRVVLEAIASMLAPTGVWCMPPGHFDCDKAGTHADLRIDAEML